MHEQNLSIQKDKHKPKITISGFKLFKLIIIFTTFVVTGFSIILIGGISDKFYFHSSIYRWIILILSIYFAYTMSKKIANNLTFREKEKISAIINPIIEENYDKKIAIKKLKKHFFANGYTVKYEDEDFLQVKKYNRIISIDFE